MGMLLLTQGPRLQQDALSHPSISLPPSRHLLLPPSAPLPSLLLFVPSCPCCVPPSLQVSPHRRPVRVRRRPFWSSWDKQHLKDKVLNMSQDPLLFFFSLGSACIVGQLAGIQLSPRGVQLRRGVPAVPCGRVESGKSGYAGDMRAICVTPATEAHLVYSHAHATSPGMLQHYTYTWYVGSHVHAT